MGSDILPSNGGSARASLYINDESQMHRGPNLALLETLRLIYAAYLVNVPWEIQFDLLPPFGFFPW